MAVEYYGPADSNGLEPCGEFWAVVPDSECVFSSREQAQEAAAQGENLRVLSVVSHFVVPATEGKEVCVRLSFLRKSWVVVSKGAPGELIIGPDGCELYGSKEQAEEVRDQGEDLIVREVVLFVTGS
jgi:hypothetical protein